MRTHASSAGNAPSLDRGKCTRTRAWHSSQRGRQVLVTLVACCSMSLTSASTWVELDGSASGSGLGSPSQFTEYGSVAFDPDGNIIVVWSGYDSHDGPRNVYLKRWNGTAWEEMGAGSATGGGITNTTNRASEPMVAVMGDASPVMAWTEGGTLYVRRWDGVQWSEMGEGSATGGGISGEENWASLQDVVVGGDGNPILAWLSTPRETSGGGVYIKRWNGQKWSEMDMWSAQHNGISGGPASSARAAVDDQGNPWVVWSRKRERDAEYQVYVKKWDGRVWVEVPQGSASGGGISQSQEGAYWPEVASREGEIYITWMEAGEEYAKDFCYLVRWNGVSWQEVSAGSASGSGVLPPGAEGRKITVDENGRILLCWTRIPGRPLPQPAEVFAKVWDGLNWREVSTGSYLAGGVTNCRGESFPRDLVMDPQNRPVLLWGFRPSLDGSGPYMLYLRRLDPETSPDAPVVTIETPQGYQVDEITFEYVLSDATSDTCGVYPQYSIDGGLSWKVATPADGGDGVTDLASSPAGIAYTFVWDSAVDEPAPAYSQTQFRLIPYDDSLVGVCEPTENFPLYRDADEDGMQDGWEIQYFGDRSQEPGGDYDDDGLPNLGEYNAGTDPTDKDTDDDNLSDSEELAENTDPLDADTDDDGLLDGDEVKTHNTDPLNSDSDNDGMTDDWEVAHGLNPNLDDTKENPDGDFLTNIEEFQYGTDPLDDSSPPTIYVDAANVGPEDGSSEHPYNTIQQAMDAASGQAGVVYVRAGLYLENVILADGIFLLGEGRDVTIIDAGGSGPVITIEGVTMGLVRGFTIRNGWGLDGGGIYSFESSVDITENRITGNLATFGGGIFCGGISPGDSPPTISDNIIENNEANSGGGIWSESSHSVLRNNVRNNTASHLGGGIHAEEECLIAFNMIEGNQAGEHGGGIRIYRDPVRIFSNLIVRNTAAEVGAGIDFRYCAPLIVNNTIVNNSTPWGGAGGIASLDDYGAIIFNCIVWGNGDDLSRVSATFCCIEDTVDDGDENVGQGNIHVDPLFRHSPTGDYHLLPNSPCVNAGKATTIEPSIDIDGDARQSGAAIDMGADECVDSDGDGIQDYWEISFFGDLSKDGGDDSDGDGLSDLDEYLLGGGPLSDDTDADGLSDAAEFSVYATALYDGDSDDDGFQDGEEVDFWNALAGSDNGWQQDTDGDGTPNLLDDDSEADGLPDGWEYSHGLRPELPDADDDPDGDELTNTEEYRFGSDPVNSESPVVVYVDANTALPGDGSYETPFRYISEAMWRAPSPAVIHLAPGEYRERVRMRDRIFLRGTDAKTTAINGFGVQWAVSCDNVGLTKISGVTITNTPQDGSEGSARGIYCTDSSLIVSQCIIKDNDHREISTDERGTGMYCYFSNVEVSDTTFSGNYSQHAGGGMGCVYSSVRISRCTFSKNSSRWTSALFFEYCENALLTDCLIVNNISSKGGPAVSAGYCSPVILNCTFVGNPTTDENVGAISVPRDLEAIVANCIIWDSGDAVEGCTVSYSCVSEIDEDERGEGVIQQDPLFVGNGDYRLQLGSPCINAGTNAYGSSLDIDGEARPYETMDIGADEAIDSDADGTLDRIEFEVFGSLDSQPDDDADGDGLTNQRELDLGTQPGNPDTDGDGLPDGQEVDVYSSDPFISDSDGDGLNDGEEVNVYSCDPTSPDSDKDGMPDGWEVEHGLLPSEMDGYDDVDGDGLTNLEEHLYASDPRDPSSPPTVFVSWKNVSGEDGSEARPWRRIQTAILASPRPAIVSVAPGRYLGAIAIPEGVILTGAGPETTIIDAMDSDSAVRFVGVELGKITGFTITNGNAWRGGGIHCVNSHPYIIGNVIAGCHASDGGGAICCESSDPRIEGNVITDSVCDAAGGGVLLADSSPTIVNNFIYGNRAYMDGGAVSCSGYSNPLILNNTIASNSTFNGRGGIWCDLFSQPGVVNCILWGNGDDLYACRATFSNIEDGDAGWGNISMLPSFVDPVAGNYRLRHYSPCIDVGNNDVDLLPATDFDGDDRIVLGSTALTVDMGADEVVPSLLVPTAALTTPSQPGRGTILLEYRLYREEPFPCSIVPQYSADGGQTWQRATEGAGGDGLWDLLSSPEGEPHLFSWDSAMDLRFDSPLNVMFRLTPASLEGTGYPESTELFVVDNSGDSDEDGLPDLWEEKYFGPGNLIQTAESDPDGDGQKNARELTARTDPANAESYFSLLEPEVHPWGVVLTWKSVNGRKYCLWFSCDLDDWSLVDGPVPASELDNTTSFTIPETGRGPVTFYRIEVLP